MHTSMDTPPLGWEFAGSMTSPGEYRSYNLVTNNSHSAGEWILLRAGILDYQSAVMDDMTYYGKITNNWMINSIFVSAVNP